jgi:hypothetical protein
MTDDLRAIAQRIVERMVREHPTETAALASGSSATTTPGEQVEHGRHHQPHRHRQ